MGNGSTAYVSASSEMPSDITICMVNYLDHNFVYLNYEHIVRNNHDFKLVIVNSIQHETDHVAKSEYYFNNYDLANFNDKRALVIPGVSRETILQHLSLRDFLKGAASYYHGFNLNLALKHVDTRYLLLLDADFFIIPSLEKIIDYMKQFDLVAYGATGNQFDWSSRLSEPSKYAPNVPGARCMLIDTSKFPIENLDFTPLLSKDSYDPEMDYWPDTGYKVSTKLMKMRTRVPNVCLDQQCDICNTICPNPLSGLKMLKETYFWKDDNELFGWHIRNTRTSKGLHQAHISSSLQSYLIFHAKYCKVKNHPQIDYYGNIYDPAI